MAYESDLMCQWFVDILFNKEFYLMNIICLPFMIKGRIKLLAGPGRFQAR